MVRVGLVGAGIWGQKIAVVLDTIPGVRLEAVVSARGLALQRSKVFSTAAEMFGAAKLDAVVIATPASSHAGLVSMSFANNLPVFVEKPFTTNYADAEELASRWTSSGEPILLVDHVQLFNPALLEMCRRVERHGGAIEIKGAHHNWGPFRSDCSALWDYGAHDVAIAMLLTDVPDNVAVTHVSDPRGFPGPMGGLGETTTIQLSLGNASARLLVGNGLPEKRRRYTVRCADSTVLEYDESSTPKLRIDEHGFVKSIPAVDSTPPLTAALKAFIDAVVEGKAPAGDGRFGVNLPLGVVRVLDDCDKFLVRRGIVRAQRQGRTLHRQ